jgi:hypothetical protein
LGAFDIEFLFKLRKMPFSHPPARARQDVRFTQAHPPTRAIISPADPPIAWQSITRDALLP